jgi:hypothetical protein
MIVYTVVTAATVDVKYILASAPDPSSSIVQSSNSTTETLISTLRISCYAQTKPLYKQIIICGVHM